MKTAISIPDALFDSADTLARRMGISRSRLYADALTEYVAKHRANKVRERLDAVYSVESSSVAPDLRRAAARAIAASEW